MKDNTKDWIEKIAKKIAETETRTPLSIKQDIINWSYYNNQPSSKKYEYLINKGDARMPMYTVHIPCQRPICDILISQQARRTWQFSTIAVDKESILSKWESKQKAFIAAQQEVNESKLEMIEDQVFEIQMQMQQIQEIMQKEPESEEEAQQIQQLQQQYPLIEREVGKIMKQFEKEMVVTQEKIDEIDHYYTHTYKDIREIIAQKLMIQVRRDFEVKKKGIENMRQNLVVGREVYLSYCDEKSNEMIYEVIDSINVKYPKIKGCQYIQNGPWVSVVDSISFESLEELYGDELEKQDIDYKNVYKDGTSTNTANFVSTPGFGAILTSGLSKEDNIQHEDGILRERIWFKKSRKVNFKVTKNLKEDAMVKEFIHMIPLHKIALDKTKYKYVKLKHDEIEVEYYINKTNKADKYLVEEVELYDPKKEHVLTKYTNDRYSCVLLNNMWIVDARKDIKLNRKSNKHSEFCLPVFGKSFSTTMDQPYSVIKNTIDLQDLYNGIYILRQLAYAIAGAKGQIIDKSQKPDGMTMDEWEANIAQGRMYIQTIDRSGRKVNNSFNQWNSFDNTVSSSVQYYDQVLLQIKETMGEIVGVPRQRQGDIIKGDLVGNTEIALQQAHLITEILYEEHDEVEAKALNEFLMLYLKYQPLDNRLLEFNEKTEGRETFFIPPEFFKGIDLELIVENNNKEQQSVELFKNILQAEYSKGTMGPNELSQLIDLESITAMRKKTEELMTKREKLAMQQQSSLIEEQKAADMEVAEYQNQLTMQAQEHANLIAEKQMEIAGFIAQSKAQIDQQDIMLKQYIEDNKHQRELQKIANEDKVEMSYLSEQSRSATVQQKLTALQIKLDALFNSIKLGIDTKGLELGHKEKMAKVATDDKKATAMAKKNPVKIKDN